MMRLAGNLYEHAIEAPPAKRLSLAIVLVAWNLARV